MRFSTIAQQLAVQLKRTRPYTPRAHGKAERFIQTLLREWAYGQPYSTSGAWHNVLGRGS